MTNLEFSNQFDVLYNNIMSNQAPGLDEYEKSVFLTKAQDEIVRSYFNPRLNKTQEGFDGNEKRQIDFSMIMRSVKYYTLDYKVSDETGEVWPTIKSFAELEELLKANNNTLTLNQGKAIDQNYIKTYQDEYTPKGRLTASPFVNSFFDYRENSNSIVLDSEILMFINEYVVVWRKSNGKSKETILTVVPITYTEYSRLMSKPYKRPLNYQAWRILDNSSNELSSVDNPVKRAELVVGPNDTITDYVIRYIKRPRAIRLIDFDDVTLDGESTEQTCELDPILHQEILQRAVELAKASYTGDLNSQIALGSSSQTNVGAVAAQSSR